MQIEPAVSSPTLAFLSGLALYVVLLGTIVLLARQKTKWLRKFFIILTNIGFLLFLNGFAFWLGAHRLLIEGALLSQLQVVFACFVLILYLFVVGWSSYWDAYFQHSKDAFHVAWLQVLFILPFCIPFLLLNVIFDGIDFLPSNWLLDFHSSIFFGLLLLGLVTIFIPYFIQRLWQCQPLPDSPLRSSLDAICQQLQFKHGGFKVWTIMQQALTAGIIGIVPHFRYIMFTQRILAEFPKEEIEAIVIHEIGHSRYKHLVFYPLLMIGIILSTHLILPLYNQILFRHFFLSLTVYSILEFILYALTLGILFRLIFGFFSRLFERQADLYIFETDVSPIYMVQALDHIGVATGYTHSRPSWHHYSLQQRMHFLESAIRLPHLVQKHHDKVKRWMLIYFLFFIILGFIYFL